jgi:hypothetical protein
MSDLDLDKLFEIYRDKFGVEDYVNCHLKKEFDSVMLLKYEMMPYWFVCELIDMGIDINEEGEPF